jgi:RNA polymerase sigma-70 factor (ECF subfamily)
MPDETLVSRYCETGDKAFVAELFERYTHLVYGICLNYLQEPEQSKDAVMDIFESLFLKLAQHHISNFRNWLYSVTRNQCLMIIRKSGTVNRLKDKLKLKTAGNDADSLDEDDNLFIHQGTIESAVEKLNTEQGTCIRLMYLEDKSYRDISAITGYSLGEVKSYIQNGKRNLRIYLRNNHDSTGE